MPHIQAGNGTVENILLTTGICYPHALHAMLSLVALGHLSGGSSLGRYCNQLLVNPEYALKPCPASSAIALACQYGLKAFPHLSLVNGLQYSLLFPRS